MENDTNIQEPNTNRKVEVNADALEKVLKDNAEMKKQIEKLTEIADKGRLAHWDATHETESPRIYRLTTYNEKIVLSWNMVTNQVWKDADGIWREKQEIELFFDDGKKLKVPYIEFITKSQKISATLLSTRQTGSQVIFEVEAENGQKYTVDSTFIN